MPFQKCLVNNRYECRSFSSSLYENKSTAKSKKQKKTKSANKLIGGRSSEQNIYVNLIKTSRQSQINPV